jgi:hypothetical protein
MSHKSLPFAAALSLLLSSRLLAGGPPWLCLPIEGATAKNAKACTARIEAKLGAKLFDQPKNYSGAEIHRDGDQQYLTFYMKEEVALGEIEAALKGSAFSIPRDKIKLFGHAILEIDLQKSSSKEITAALDAMDNVSIDDSAVNQGQLLATVQMPYPVVDNRPNPNDLRWETFARNDYTAADSSKSETPIAAKALPGFHAFRDLLSSQGASLKDVRWSTTHACRALGCVVVPQDEAVVAATELSSQQRN